ncbi:MAG TPA: SIMPL domain-containing protein [Candidatus Binatia bacterium]|jgi:hypothetical protein
MAVTETPQRTLAALVLGVCLIAGLAAGGYFIGRGGSRFKSDTRTVTVKGLVEREVKADQAVWSLRVRRAGDDLRDAQTKISADRDAVVAFLKKRGFKDGEIEPQPIVIFDKLARQYGQTQNERFRYVVSAAVDIRTANVELVRSSLGATDELLKAGIVLDGENEGRAANPRYVVSKFNELRPELLAEATKNARKIAEQFAADSGTRVGSIRSANQGTIQIFGTDGNDESAPYSQTSTPAKKIRVVSTFEFELK